MSQAPNSYRAVTIDDEPQLSEILRIKLNKICPHVEIVGTAASVEEGQQVIADLKPDILFLDVNMPDGTGFDLLEELSYRDFQLVMVTGYSEHAIRALKLSAVDYLLKPVSTSELRTAVENCIENIEANRSLPDHKGLISNAQETDPDKHRIAIPSQEGYEFIKVGEIIRCEGWEKYTRIYVGAGRVIVSSYNIGHYGDLLEGYGFYQSHRSHIVQLQHIVRYLNEGLLVMSDGSNVPVSRRRRDEFLTMWVKGN